MPLIITRQSYDSRCALKKKLEDRKRDATKEKQIAREQGDLRENAGFAEAKRDIRQLGHRIENLELERPDLQIVNPKEWCRIDMLGEPNACVGAMVEIQRGNGRTEEFIIGGAWDTDLESDKIIPYTCPLAKLLIPHDVGFKGVLETNKETITLISSRPPTPEEIKAIYGSLEKKKTIPDPGLEMSM